MLYPLIRLNRNAIILLTALILIGLSKSAFAQPPNDDCFSAQILCMDETTLGTTAGASAGNNICFIPHASVWYSFTTNDIGGNVNVIVDRDTICNTPGSTGDGLEGVVFTADSPCDIATMTAVSNCLSGEYNFVLSAPSLAPNTEYWIQIDALINDQGDTTSCDFSIAVTGPGVSISAGPDHIIVAGQGALLLGSGADTYSWTPSNTLDNPSSASPVATPTETTTYLLTGSRNGCSSTDNVTVFIVDPLKVPNAFTPNGDGFNDTWEINRIELFPNVIVEVFNRWGQRVFSSVGYSNPWNGTNDGNYLPEGTYYWVIQLNDPGIENEVALTGFVAIIR